MAQTNNGANVASAPEDQGAMERVSPHLAAGSPSFASPGGAAPQPGAAATTEGPLFERLPGEQDIMALKYTTDLESAVLLSPVDAGYIHISFFLTTYRLIAIPKPYFVQPIFIPLPAIEAWSTGKEGAFYTLEIATKTVWSFKLGFRAERWVSHCQTALESLKAKKLMQLPAFDLGTAALKAMDPCDNYGWNLYEEDEELNRQLCLDPTAAPCDPASDACGVGKDLRPWFRNTSLNQPENTFGSSPTYPFKFIVPNSCSDGFLVECLSARSRGRIPAISFVNLKSGGVLARSSQPLTFKGKNRVDDANLCAYLVNNYSQQNTQPRDRVFSSQLAFNSGNSSGTGDTTGSASGSPSGSPGRKASVAPTWKPPPSLADDGAPPPPLAQSFKSPSSTGTGAGVPGDSAPPQAALPPSTPVGTPNVAGGKSGSRYLNVIDLRPYAAATGNLATGGGYETGNFYEHCKVTFSAIDNIHAVTASWNKMRQLIQATMGRNVKGDFFKDWVDTKWIFHIQKILAAAVGIVELLERGESVLTHCTDGWDRTSQATSLSMILLDPYYRTVHGFCVLIEKEWCAFGHKFGERCNHLLPGTTFCVTGTVISSDVEQAGPGPAKIQISPIFVQWLDCVYQIIRQFPNQFEFTPSLLEFLAFHVYSCFYGTFLTNTAKERLFEGIRSKTLSLWTEVLRVVQQEREGKTPMQFLNRYYDAENAATYIRKQRDCGIHRLFLSVSSKRLVFWEDFYLKHDSDAFRLGMCLPSRDPCSMAERSTVPSYISKNPVTELCDALVFKAQRRRVDELEYTELLLPKLNVPRVPQQAPPQVGDGSGPSGVVSLGGKQPTLDKSKECRKCRVSFGFFNPVSHCQHCYQAFCSKCLKQVGAPKYEKFCESCFAIQHEQVVPTEEND